MQADWVELVWTTQAVAGLVYSVYCLSDYVKVRSELLMFQINGDVIGHIGETIRREAIRAIIQTLLSLVGVIAMFRAPSGEPYDAGRLTSIAFLVLMSGLHTLNTHLDRRSALRRRKRGDHTFEELTTETLERIERAGEMAAGAARQVASELQNSQGRADAIDGVPGESADAASRSGKED